MNFINNFINPLIEQLTEEFEDMFGYSEICNALKMYSEYLYKFKIGDGSLLLSNCYKLDCYKLNNNEIEKAF